MSGVLLGEWGFLDNLNDTSGNGRHASLGTGTVTYETGPQTGTRAVRFTGTGQWITYGRTGLEPAAAAGGICTMAWVKWDAGSTATSYHGIIHKSRDGAGSTRAGFQTNNRRFRPFSRWRDQLAFSDGIGDADLAGDGWVHMAVVDADDRYQWYQNGVSVQTATRTGTGPVSWENFPWISGYSAGECQSNTGLAISGVRIFSGSLTTTEVNTWMNTPITGRSGKAKVWDGSAWVSRPVKIWNGSAWVTHPVKVWNGSSWVLSK